MKWEGADFEKEWRQAKNKHGARVRAEFMKHVGEQLDSALDALRNGKSFFSNQFFVEGMTCAQRTELVGEVAQVNPTAARLIDTDNWPCSRVDVWISVPAKKFPGK